MRYAVCMKRTTVMLPDDVDRRVRYEADRRGMSIAELVREALEQHLPTPPESGYLSFVAVGEGAPRDVSEYVEPHVARSIERRRGHSS